jgi:23S rRNA (cytidine1920-2'-O)/16S rRNA (cytidine1409-2'-O)-methyltransferase
MSDRPRLDELLVRRGDYASRSRARDAILRGAVRVDGVPATKPSQGVAADALVTVADEARAYVSRSAVKLAHGLSHFGIPVAGRHALDIGASTGGFTQVLLERDAAHVTAIDVGHGQMRVDDPRVTVIEGLNARDLAAHHLAHVPELIVCDVSFISLRLALPGALALAAPGAHLVALVKPQFEVGREAIGKGVVRDAAAQEEAVAAVARFLEERGWHVQGIIASPIAGGDGNREFLLAATKALIITAL